MSRSVPAIVTRSVHAIVSRSVPVVVSRLVPAVESRSVPAVESRSVPAVMSRSVPAVVSKSVPAVVSRSVPVVVSRLIPAVVSRSVPAVVSRSVPREVTTSVLVSCENCVRCTVRLSMFTSPIVNPNPVRDSLLSVLLRLIMWIAGHTNSGGHSKANFPPVLGSYVNVVKGSASSVFIKDSPALVLDDSCVMVRDLSRSVMGKVKELSSIPNLTTLLTKEGFSEPKLTYLGGMWVMIELANEVTRNNMLLHTGVKSWFHIVQLASSNFVSDERVVWVNIEGVSLHLWSFDTFIKIGSKWGETMDLERTSVLCLLENVCVSKPRCRITFWRNLKSFIMDNEGLISGNKKAAGSRQEGDVVVDDSDEEGVFETFFDDIHSSPSNNSGHKSVQAEEQAGDQLSADPFELRDLLNKHPKDIVQEEDHSMSHPPGFTPAVSRQDDTCSAEGMESGVAKENSSGVHSKVMSHAEEGQDKEALNGNSQFSHSHVPKGGLGHKTKKEWVKELNLKHKVNFLTLHKIKMDIITHMDVKYIWGNSNYNFVTSDSVGNSGGILCIWEDNVFTKDHVTISDNFVAIYGSWNSNKSQVLFVVVYAPQSIALKRVLWEYISLLISRWDGETIVMGDFNEVRSSDERLGSVFNLSSARSFNSFYFGVGIGRRKDGRVFIHVVSSLGQVGFDAMVELAWTSFLHSDSNLLVRFKKKLQALKFIIRGRIKDKHLNQSGVTWSIKEELITIDKMFDSENASDMLRLKRLDFNRQLNDIKSLESSDWLQKSKIKWAVEGDENSKFFHGIINKKRSQLSIRGILMDGQWKTDPDVVKDTFKDHFANRFKHPQQSRFKLNFAFPNRLSNDQVVDLDRCISHDEIRSAVWNCGVNKSPGPNGPISLIGSLYKVVTKILANSLATVISDLVSDTQFAFVSNRQILDGPFILNEILAWCKRKKKHAMIFKVDFAKAYDSVRWDYLLDVLLAFGFGPNLCKWIRGTFSSSMASVLVNGSPSLEFPFFCGFKQGDPLAPFLFILIMESLHISFSRATSEGVFNRIQIHESLKVSR
nr:RNA-directed DNA polymerase, eukaryota [Tanacetum cinerariifolium]